MVRGIHQFLTGFDYGDAISNFAIEIRDVLRQMGYESEIYAKFIAPEVRKEAHFYTEYTYESSSDNVVLFHFSIGSSVTGYVRALPDRKVLVYHNITPAEFFDDFDSHVAAHLRNGRNELVSFREVVELAIGVSRYDCAELEEYGFKQVECLPLIISIDRMDRGYDKRILERYRDGKVNILFVGRVVPNKKIEDLVKVFYLYKKYLNEDARLLVVGGHDMWSKYHTFLKGFIKNLGLEEDVILTDKVKDSELVAYYRVADVYLSMSEHEGFGLPLLEAMHFGIPVVAYGAAAVPETVGEGGIVVESKDYATIAEVVDKVVKDGSLRDYLVKKGRKRLSLFSRDRWVDMLKRLVVKSIDNRLEGVI